MSRGMKDKRSKYANHPLRRPLWRSSCILLDTHTSPILKFISSRRGEHDSFCGMSDNRPMHRHYHYHCRLSATIGGQRPRTRRLRLFHARPERPGKGRRPPPLPVTRTPPSALVRSAAKAPGPCRLTGLAPHRPPGLTRARKPDVDAVLGPNGTKRKFGAKAASMPDVNAARAVPVVSRCPGYGGQCGAENLHVRRWCTGYG